jgi:hypothetical protein
MNGRKIAIRKRRSGIGDMYFKFFMVWIVGLVGLFGMFYLIISILYTRRNPTSGEEVPFSSAVL